jgi:hypothetical protein
MSQSMRSGGWLTVVVGAVAVVGVAVVTWRFGPGLWGREANSQSPAAAPAGKPGAEGKRGSTEKTGAVAPPLDDKNAVASVPGTGISATGAAADASRAVVPVGPEQRTLDITFDHIRFSMDDPKSRLFQRTMLTDKIERLAGRAVRIRGYILPTSRTTLKQFVLVRDNMECCFGDGAALYDCILVEMADGQTTRFTIRPVAVEGTFTIREMVGPDGKHLAIYHLTATSVE